jgi:phage shock protein A/mono/diheme cytochrome c family protein
MMRTSRHFLPAMLVASLAAGLAADEKVSFNRQIKPILANKCFVCHGPDEKERKAELRLDVRDEAVPSVIKPNDAEHSEVVVRITSGDPDLRMPPVMSKRPVLTADEIALVRKWIDQGAEYDAHWAYVRPTRPPVPSIQNPKSKIQNPIDAFLLARLSEKGLTFAPPADKRTLLRRLSFDVVGLPATGQELAEFESDASLQAYEKEVDRLLAIKHFGERMAMYWLDVVRYADTGGYHSDNHRDVWLYRDWVIEAFNENKRFDQFVTEQLAGDLLPDATGEQRIASGFNRLLQTTEEGGAQPKEYTAKYAADRVRNTAAIFLASTMGCCECHSHKFDPFTQKDFYRFAAFFADVSEKAVGRQDQTKIALPEQEAQRKQLDEQLAQARTQFTAKTPELAAARAKWEAAAKAALDSGKNAWLSVRPAKLEAKNKTKLDTLTQGVSEGSAAVDETVVVASGPNPEKETYTLTLPAETAGLRGLRLEALTDPSFPNKGLSRANGNFVLTEIEVAAVGADDKPAPVKLSAAEADFSQENYPVANAIDGKTDTGWAVAGHEKPADHTAVFTFAEPVGGPGVKLLVKLHHDSQFAGHNIGRFRLSLTTAEKPDLSGQGLPAAVMAALQAAVDQRSPQDEQALDAHFRQVAPELAAVREQIAKLEADKTKLVESFPATLVSAAAEPRMVRVLPRGNWLDDSGELQEPAIPGFLVAKITPAENQRRTRLDLARWMTAPDNPLTARVFVNRLWKLVFGRGLVRSLDDFGSQGELPTHPELLDWLAVEFQESGWDVKHVLKLMLMSQAYRQTSVPPADALAKDPTNDLFSRQYRYRLDAELVRDNALAVSGLLVPKIGGPSVKPYQPAGYWQYLNFPKREWENDNGESQYRRGLYTYWQRTFLHPSLAAFDAPSREECTVQRPVSNTPQQALVLLNDPTYVEAARALAAKVLTAGGSTTPERLEFAFRQVLVRSPRPEEAQTLSALVEKHRAEFAADRPAAEKLLKVGDLSSPANLDPAELAAWTSVCRVLLNLHETITRN